MLQRVREAYARFEGGAAFFYGPTVAFAMAAPLVAGALTGRAALGSVLAQGAYLVALRGPEGPYGKQAKNLFGAALIVAVGATVGGNLAGHPWVAAAVVPVVVALGSTVRWIGETAALTVLLTAVRPPGTHIVLNGVVELIGGVWVALLLLSPWPARRLKPLRTALGAAAEAVAAALDTVAADIGDHDTRALDAVRSDLADVARAKAWDDRRRTAREALGNARTTLGHYAIGDGPSRPERLVDALGRIMHETVALRTLIDAAERRPPGRDWELEARVAILALAARLRLIGGAVRSGGEFPLGAEGSPAVRRLVRRTDEIRRASLAGDEDMVAAALVSQIRGSVDRIIGNVESARRITAGGVRVGVGPPRLPLISPAAVLDRAGSALRTRSPGFRQMTRVAVAVAVAMALTAALHLKHGQWLTLTVMNGVRTTYGETVTNLLQRVGGSVAGSAIAAVLLAVAPDQLGAAFVVFAFAAVGFSLRRVNFTFWGLFGTPLAMMLLSFSTPSDWTVAAERITLTLGGCVLVFLAVRLLWPPGFNERMPVQVAKVLSTQADLVRATSAVVRDGAGSVASDTLRAAEKAIESVADTRRRLDDERVPDTELVEELRGVARTAYRIRDHLIAVGRMSREESVDSGPIPEILDRLADELDEAASILDEHDNVNVSPKVRLDEEFADLDDHLSGLARRRRAEVEGGTPRDELTPLQHALVQVSGTRHALRELRDDATELIGAALRTS
ncbi:Inner membrane protein YccS [Actinomadura rubteroloni]|uniref:Inner membrane protein YccS n=1 Tax=Actinomadura rubteroloni TaxID=1926885 RepID=A0A2P4ULX1_9ACTN|nr:FUSC family protein [Actinomadura rubteroloni]POM25999.1 Inner membrane protein YccS [Actinomadura rubteroloni]